MAETTGRQYVLRIKSLLGYAHRLGYITFNAGATIKVRSDARNRDATLAKRIISEIDVALLVRSARTKRDRVLLEVLYAGGLRVSEIVVLTWADVPERDKGQVPLSVLGEGGVVRQVLLPAVSRSLQSLRGDAGNYDPVFASRKGGAPLLPSSGQRRLKQQQDQGRQCCGRPIRTASRKPRGNGRWR
jgi:integrase/recombinase XerD